MHFRNIVGLTLLWLLRVHAQTLQCASLAGGCNGGAAYESALKSAIARFETNKVYGGRRDTFSSSLVGGALAEIAYSCRDGSIPPALAGSSVQSLLNQILSCSDRCGSVSVAGNDNCGFGVVIANDVVSGSCFSKAIDVVPESGNASEKPSVGTFNSKGCWTDSATSKALTGGSSNAADMTVEKCVALAKGFKYAGVESSTQCFWGNDIAPASSQASGQCNMPCGGQPSDLCGGQNLINIYEDSTFAPSTPIVVPSVGDFHNDGCFTDSSSARVLVAGSSIDQSPTGMTVEKCVNFAQKNSWRYAGVENGGECYVGNTLHGATAASPGDCNKVCAGSPAEFCGNENRIQVYEDSAWKDPTADDLAAVLQTYNSTLVQVSDAIGKYKSDIEALKTAQGRRRRVKRQTQTEEILLQEIVHDHQQLDSVRVLLDRAAQQGNRLFVIAHDLDIQRPTTPLVDSNALGDLSDATSLASSSLADVTEAAADDAATIASSTTPLLNFARDLSVVEGAVSHMAPPVGEEKLTPDNQISNIGKAGVIGGGAAAATGIFLVILNLFNLFHHDSPPPPPPPPTTTAISTSTTTSTSCTFTATQTPIIIVTREGTTNDQFDALVKGLPTNPQNREFRDSAIGKWWYYAVLDQCTSEQLWDNPIVEAMAIDSLAVQSDADTEVLQPQPLAKRAASVTKEMRSPEPNQEAPNTTYSGMSLETRALADDSHIVLQQNAPNHLKWISALSGQTALTGEYYDFEDFVYDDREGKSVVAPSWIYYIDGSGFIMHNDFADRVQLHTYANIAGDTGLTALSSHGTSMASCAAGKYSGPAKDAFLGLIKLISNDPRLYPVSSTIIAFDTILRHAAGNNAQGRAVVAMSFAAPSDVLWWRHPQIERPRGQTLSDLNDVFGTKLLDLYKAGIAAVCSAGNFANYGRPVSDLSYSAPRRNGGRDSPLVVVGNNHPDLTRHATSQYVDSLDRGILSIYAVGVDCVCGSSSGPNDWDTLSGGLDGTSQATAQVAGVMAHILSDSDVRRDLVAGGVQNMPMNLKNYLLNLARANKQVPADGIPRLSNGVNIPCSGSTTTGRPPVPPPGAAPPPTQNNLALMTTEVAAGTTVTFPQAQLPVCYNLQ